METFKHTTFREAANEAFRKALNESDSPFLAILNNDADMWARCFPYDARARDKFIAAGGYRGPTMTAAQSTDKPPLLAEWGKLPQEEIETTWRDTTLRPNGKEEKS